MTPEERAAKLVESWTGKRVTLNQHRDDIAAAIREAVAAVLERCAALCEQVQAELDAAYSPEGCTDAARVTPEERAEKVTAGWVGLVLKAVPTTPGIDIDSVVTDSGGVVMARELIATAIRGAVAAERDRCAALCEQVGAAYPNDVYGVADLSARRIRAS